jgi:hypothetical protein
LSGVQLLELPCLVGLSLTQRPGGPSAVECDLTGGLSGKLSFIVDLGSIASNLNKIVPAALPIPVPGHSLMSGADSYSLQALRGTAEFTAADVSGRSFMGRFVDAEMVFSRAGTADVVCHSRNTLYSGAPGNFL